MMRLYATTKNQKMRSQKHLSSDESECVAIIENMKRPRGRPPKLQALDPLSDYVAVLETIKRPRGRPLKQPELNNNIQNKRSNIGLIMK